ncbi:MAG: hypothetical protein HYR75_03845 [Gemmatimonadetes bacterium]|nr:hypothetical protein [Gemmatimonadota bacterium]
MEIEVRVEPNDQPLPKVTYRWDADTDILTATLHATAAGEGMSGAVEIEGSDGSWLVFDVTGGRITSGEVAVWPDVRKVAGLAPPADVIGARVTLPARRSQPGLASLEVDTQVSAMSDPAEHTFHFRIGAVRAVRHVQFAKDLALDVDERDRVAGVWLLNVPPFPAEP